MNQTAFLSQLRQALNRQGVSDIDDILADFEEHFANGKATGKDEEAIAEELGDPLEIAAQYGGEQPQREPVSGAGQGPANDWQAGGSTGSDWRRGSDAGQDAGVRSQPFSGSASGQRAHAAGPASGFVYVEDSRGKPRATTGQTQPGSGYSQPKPGTRYTQPGTGYTQPQVTGTGGYARTEPAPDASQSAIRGSQPQATGTGGYARTEAEHVPVERNDSSGLSIVLLILLGLFVILPAALTAIGILIGLWAAAFGVGAGSIALFVAAAAEIGTTTLILILFAISLAALSILLFIGAYWLSRLFALGIRAYVRWNRQVAKGGVTA